MTLAVLVSVTLAAHYPTAQIKICQITINQMETIAIKMNNLA
jgi:hypothetical protein